MLCVCNSEQMSTSLVIVGVLMRSISRAEFCELHCAGIKQWQQKQQEKFVLLQEFICYSLSPLLALNALLEHAGY